jgi:hypothetical protein
MAGGAADEIELLWLGPQDDAAEDAERESEEPDATASVEEAPAEADDDQLTRIAEDQGWDAAEVEAMRVYLDESHPEEVAAPDASTAPDEAAEPRPPADGAGRAMTPSAVAWPKEDSHPSWRLPGADELDEALAALRPTYDVPLPGLDAGAPEPDPAWRERRVVFGSARGDAQAEPPAQAETVAQAEPPAQPKPPAPPSSSYEATPPTMGAPAMPEATAGSDGTSADDSTADLEAPPHPPLPSLFGRPRRFAPAPTDAKLLRDRVGPQEPDRGEPPEPLTAPREAGASTEGEAIQDESEQPDAGGEPEWLRGRRDPAARAYRRLRRIFPN